MQGTPCLDEFWGVAGTGGIGGTITEGPEKLPALGDTKPSKGWIHRDNMISIVKENCNEHIFRHKTFKQL